MKQIFISVLWQNRELNIGQFLLFEAKIPYYTNTSFHDQMFNRLAYC